MIPVDEARSRILAALPVVESETVALADAHGRTLAQDIVARLSQPPFAVSAMDGYAVRSADVIRTPTVLTIVGAAPAGGRHDGAIGLGQTVRIFTGGPMPTGADAVVIQENTEPAGGGRPGETVTIWEQAREGAFVRPAGLDFQADADSLPAGRLLTARAIGLAAAMNHPWLPVRQRPRIGLLATGDEVVQPGDPLGPNQIVSSNVHALAALVRACGGAPVNLGIARDDPADLIRRAGAAVGLDMLVTTGGASAGDHDLMRDVLGDRGRGLDFWRIAMRPGKPLMFGHYRDSPLLGLPGNPVSAQVCALLFLVPAIRRMLGHAVTDPAEMTTILASDLVENDQREDYLRGKIEPDGRVRAFDQQDSSLARLLADADCLIRRPPHGPAVRAGDTVPVLPFPPGC